jgi:flavin reductase (DIM6/NTAB) family NADH-FMN oxidoreductase RutF
MFYLAGQRDKTLLPHDPFKAIVAPRPIGWISTRSPEGWVNLAPYSFFNAICTLPPLVMFSSEGAKDAATSAEASGEFVCNLATYALRDAMNATSAPLPRGVSEFGHAGLTEAECRIVKAPRVAESPASLECKVIDVIRPMRLDGASAGVIMVLGQVVGVHIDAAYVVNGQFDMVKAGTISRAGYADYVRAESVFSIVRPAGAGGSEGSGPT